MSHRFVFGLVLLLAALSVMTTGRRTTGEPQSGVFAHEAHVASTRAEVKKRRIVVFGGHTEDPSFGCGGLIARLTKAGHEVLIASASCNRADRKIGDEPEAEVRRREATQACKLLGATPHFLEYEQRTLIADEATLEMVSTWLKQVKPDIVVTHWPLDTNSSHHVMSSLVWQSYLHDRKWSLYFFENLTDYQTVAFTPDLFLDIGDVHDLKKEACYCHQSLKPERFWFDQEDVHRRRGEESRVRYAEAFVLAEPLAGRAVLPVPFLKKRTGSSE